MPVECQPLVGYLLNLTVSLTIRTVARGKGCSGEFIRQLTDHVAAKSGCGKTPSELSFCRAFIAESGYP
jgi:hypothetical protein